MSAPTRLSARESNPDGTAHFVDVSTPSERIFAQLEDDEGHRVA